MLPQIVFVQNSVHLAGAQKSLSRLLAAPGMREYDPVLLTAQTGWLTEHCEAHHVKWQLVPFPASRSLLARIQGNRSFAKKAARSLKNLIQPGRPLIVHVNDHPDSLLGLALAQELRAASVLTLRTPGMSQRDFEKYRCGAHGHLIAVGEELFNKVKPWVAGSKPLTLVHNGVTEEEIFPPPVPAKEIVDRLVVLGSIIPRKGWQDLVEALLLLEKRLPSGALPEVHFLGDLLGQDPEEVLGVGRLQRFKTSFLGTDPQYRARLLQYPLAIHPSRSESFGMAALECVAAGVPLLAASTGLIPDFIPQPPFLFPPQQPAALADLLECLLKTTPQDLTGTFGFGVAHEIIRDRFSTPGTVRKLKAIYAGLASQAV